MEFSFSLRQISRDVGQTYAYKFAAFSLVSQILLAVNAMKLRSLQLNLFPCRGIFGTVVSFL